MQRVVELYKTGISLREIEKRTGINRKRASLYLKNNGYKVKVRSRGNTGMANYPLDDSVFEKIDTEEKACWLGFLSFLARVPPLQSILTKHSE